MLLSCSQEEPQGDAAEANDSRIVFRTSLAETNSRSNDNITQVSDLNSDGFSVTAFYPEANVTGAFNPYIAELSAQPLEDKTGYFGITDDQTEEPCEWPSARHGKEGRLKFFAFYPSREAMRQSAGVGSTYFGLENKSTKNGATITYDYRMKKFKVHSEITRHVDFVATTAEGTKRANGDNGVKLAFEHQLCRIVLTAWGNTQNDIEIAGVRVGNAIIESDFNFAGTPDNYKQGEDNTTTGRWITPQVKGSVEYIFHEGDNVVKIGRGNHTSSNAAISIMGSAGGAMVIPAENKGWKHTATNDKGLYFSVLLRVKENDESNTMVYPYVIGGNLSNTVSTDAMSVVYLAINSKTGKVMKRLYRNKDNGKYYTDPDLTEAYNVPQGEDVRNYGWAAVPLSPNTTYRWKAGYQYTYALNYSAGVGVHDPADPYPGKPIISKVLVGVTEGQQTWPMVVDNFSSGDSVDITNDVIVK